MGIFAMPSLGADMEAGTLVEWLVSPGDTVRRGDVVAVVETQKGAIEIEIFEEGTVHRLEAEIGKELPVGAPLALVLADGEAPPPDTPMIERSAPSGEIHPPKAEAPSASPIPERPRAVDGESAASPAARVRAHELGIDLAAITGTGPGGVIVLSDVESPRAPVPQAVPKASPMTEMRKAIAAAMTRSKQTIPHVYLTHTIDLQPAETWLTQRNEGAAPPDRVLLGALFVRAAALAAAKVKELNGHFLADGYQASERINPGVAVALRGGGLVAPALMDAPSMTLGETMEAMRDLVSRARAGRLRSSEMTDGTLTVSALGESGAEAMAGVIFPPQVALVGLGAPQTRPWIVDGEVVPRTVVTLTVSADHRVADGRQVARYIAAFEKLLQSPEQL